MEKDALCRRMSAAADLPASATWKNNRRLKKLPLPPDSREESCINHAAPVLLLRAPIKELSLAIGSIQIVLISHGDNDMEGDTLDRSRRALMSGMAGGVLAFPESSYASGQVYGTVGGRGGP